MTHSPIHIIGGGLAGSEAAWQIASAGIPVILHEMRGVRGTDAHKTDHLAELVCSNSFRSDDADNQCGRPAARRNAPRRLADHGLRRCASGAGRLGAGGGPRWIFRSRDASNSTAHPLVTIVREEITGLPPQEWGTTIIATGPLTAPALAESIRARNRRRIARLLRRHCADRPFRLDRPGHRLVPVALRQGRPRRHRQGLHQLPDGQGPVFRLCRGGESRATRPNSRNGKARPISTAACRSK